MGGANVHACMRTRAWLGRDPVASFVRKDTPRTADMLDEILETSLTDLARIILPLPRMRTRALWPHAPGSRQATVYTIHAIPCFLCLAAVREIFDNRQFLHPFKRPEAWTFKGLVQVSKFDSISLADGHLVVVWCPSPRKPRSGFFALYRLRSHKTAKQGYRKMLIMAFANKAPIRPLRSRSGRLKLVAFPCPRTQ